MKLTIKEINFIKEALETKVSSLQYYVDLKDDDGNYSYPEDRLLYSDISALLNKIEKTEV